MEYIIIVAISILLLIIFAWILGFNIRKLKQIADDKKLDEITATFPENIEICKSILNKLGNNSVVIKEEKESKTSLYLIFNNTITIANIRNSFTRIQTIAHECLHSVQSKRMLWFNFIYTNIYMLYFLIISILTILHIIKMPHLFLEILIIMGLIHYSIRSMLETDAMTKARYVAKEYLEENNICDNETIQKLVAKYDLMNDMGIKLVNYEILSKEILKIIIYCIICIIIL